MEGLKVRSGFLVTHDQPTIVWEPSHRPFHDVARLAQAATDAASAAHYLAMAEQYLVVAEAEYKLAAQLEKLMPPSTAQ